MKLFQLKDDEFEKVRKAGIRALVVERQVFGQKSEFLYHAIIPSDQQDAFTQLEAGRAIEDKGRTAGFWQSLGGEGIYKPNLSGLQGFSQNLTELLKGQPEATLGFEGDTWEEILRSMPLPKVHDQFLGVEAVPEVEESNEESSDDNDEDDER